MIIVDSDEMSLIDVSASETFRYPALLLMENAGLNCYSYLEKNILSGQSNEKVLFICGSGNNGGDGLVMARHHFLRGRSATVIMTGKIPETGISGENFILCKNLGIKIIEYTKEKDKAVKEIEESAVIVDAVAGTGLKGRLREREAEICALVNSSNSFVCSVDVPSGLGDSFESSFPSVIADVTLTIALPKICLFFPSTRKRCGKIVLTDAAFPPCLLKPEKSDKFILDVPPCPDTPEVAGRKWAAEKRLKESPRHKSGAGCLAINSLIDFPKMWSYKNMRGHTAVFAGSRGKSGAAALCAVSALKSLAGLVTLYTDEEVYPPLSAASFSVMVDIFAPGTAGKDFQQLTERFDAFVTGPGWGMDKAKNDFLDYLVDKTDKPLIIDADALTMLSERIRAKGLERYRNSNIIMTPHPGEFSRLTGKSTGEILDNPLPHLRQFSSETGAVVLLKSHIPWICEPGGKIFILDRMNPALATAGSGDVLAGIAGGLAAAGKPAADTACAAAIVHSMAGKLAFDEKGFFSSDELAGFITPALKLVWQDMQNE